MVTWTFSMSYDGYGLLKWKDLLQLSYQQLLIPFTGENDTDVSCLYWEKKWKCLKTSEMVIKQINTFHCHLTSKVVVSDIKSWESIPDRIFVVALYCGRIMSKFCKLTFCSKFDGVTVNTYLVSAIWYVVCRCDTAEGSLGELRWGT